MPIAVPDWVPVGMRALFEAMHARPPVTGEMAALFDRLSAHLAMREVWQELPDEPQGRHAFIKCIIAHGYNLAMSVRPPFPRSRSEVQQYLSRYPVPTTPGMVAVALRNAVLGMQQYNPLAEAYRSAWTQRPDHEELAKLLLQEADYHDHLEAQLRAELEELNRQLSFPKPPRKRRSADASQIYFSRILSAVFQKLYSDPKDHLVATITDVAFDLQGEIGSETARNRRRSSTKPN